MRKCKPRTEVSLRYCWITHACKFGHMPCSIKFLETESHAFGFLAAQAYGRAQDTPALVRLHCAAGDFPQAEQAAAQPGASPAAAFHLAQQVHV